MFVDDGVSLKQSAQTGIVIVTRPFKKEYIVQKYMKEKLKIDSNHFEELLFHPQGSKCKQRDCFHPEVEGCCKKKKILLFLSFFMNCMKTPDLLQVDLLIIE